MGLVCWWELVGYLVDVGVIEFWEIGVGKVLLGMIKCIVKEVVVKNVGLFVDIVVLKG